MKLGGACIPLGGAWTSPFARWQGPLAELSSLDLAVAVTRRALADRALSPTAIDEVVLGLTIPQRGAFYGAPTVAARLGAEAVTGPMIAQACATSAACLQVAALGAERDPDAVRLVIATDRTSNGPHIVYPAPGRPGGAPLHEDWVLDNFACDPWAGDAMIATAERVAGEARITREELDDVTLLRYEQYTSALADDRAFQRRYFVDVELPARSSRAPATVVDADVGVHPTTREGLARLRPVTDGGVVTFGSQTHPADGAAGMLVCGERRARELSRDGGVARILAVGTARVGKGEMPKAPVPAAEAALRDAGVAASALDAVTTHNPFAVNDVLLARATGIPFDRMNARGCSLVYGHPQGPTGARLICELIETLRERGGGTGLFTGCAAGDTGAAVVVRVED